MPPGKTLKDIKMIDELRNREYDPWSTYDAQRFAMATFMNAGEGKDPYLVLRQIIKEDRLDVVRYMYS